MSAFAEKLALKISSFMIGNKYVGPLDRFCEIATPFASGVKNHGFPCPPDTVLTTSRSKVLLGLPFSDFSELDAWFKFLFIVNQKMPILEMRSSRIVIEFGKKLGVNLALLRLPYIEVRSGVPRLRLITTLEYLKCLQTDNFLEFLTALIQTAMFGFHITVVNVKAMEWEEDVYYYIRSRCFQGIYDSNAISASFKDVKIPLTSVFLGMNQFTKDISNISQIGKSVDQYVTKAIVDKRLREIHQELNHTHFLGDSSEVVQALADVDRLKASQDYSTYIKTPSKLRKVGPVLFDNITKMKLPILYPTQQMIEGQPVYGMMDTDKVSWFNKKRSMF